MWLRRGGLWFWRIFGKPDIQRGIDLAGKTKIVFAAGRGKTGKTTLLRWLTEISILHGGSPILADVDPSNATFSNYFADVARPDTDSPVGVTMWLQDMIEHCIAERQSAIIDLGGGDTTLRSLASEMPGLADHIEASGLAPVLFHLVGTQPEDLSPSVTLTSRGFTPKAQALVFNEFSIEAGFTRDRAFSRIIASPSYSTLAQSSVRLGAQTAYITPGSPWENGYIESFNARLRDEFLNGEIFYTLQEAKILIEVWRRQYNTIRPHSSLGYRPPVPEVLMWPAPPAALIGALPATSKPLQIHHTNYI